MGKPIYLDNDDLPRAKVTTPHEQNDNPVPATGLTGLTFRLSLTDGGTAIHSSLSVNATERSGAPGVYYAVFQGSDLRTHLAAYIGTDVWQIFGDGVNIHTSEARRVIERRRP